MEKSSGENEKKLRFSVIQIEEKPEEPLLKLVLNNDQTSELVRKISEVRSDDQDTVMTQIIVEDDIKEVRRSSLIKAFRNSRLSLINKDTSTRLLSEEEKHCLADVAEETQEKKQPQENTTLYTKRLVEKNGESNVLPRSSKRGRFIMKDFYTTLSDLKWRHCLLICIAAYLSTWTMFALIYYIIASIHQDIVHHDDPKWDSCILNVHSFITSFLFSVETQHTIGYGYRAMKETCPPAVMVSMVQSCASVLINSLFCGLIFAKLMSPQYRSRLVRFSRQAVVSFHNGVPCFIFRVIDFQESNLVNCNVKAVLIRDRVTKEGEFIPFNNRNFSLRIEETVSNNLFIVWPVNVVHVIDSQSPLFGLTPRELQEEYLEIIVILEGVVENSGKLMQGRTSYTSREILWGASFSPMMTFNQKSNRYEMDYSKFDEIELTLPLPYISLSKRYLRTDVPEKSSDSYNLENSSPSKNSPSKSNSRYRRHNFVRSRYSYNMN